MISHKYKCIFVHIQRTGGSSIETWINGDDWWKIEKSTKHLLASQAKSLYKDYWDDYFKFAIIRNPYDRMVSMTLKHSKQHNLKLENNKIQFKGYKERYGYPLTIENDWRFSDRKNLIHDKHIENAIYSNILDEKLDYIGYFEQYNQVINYLKEKLGVEKQFNFHISKTKNKKNYLNYYDTYNINEINKLYKNDLERFNYKTV